MHYDMPPLLEKRAALVKGTNSSPRNLCCTISPPAFCWTIPPARTSRPVSAPHLLGRVEPRPPRPQPSANNSHTPNNRHPGESRDPAVPQSQNRRHGHQRFPVFAGMTTERRGSGHTRCVRARRNCCPRSPDEAKRNPGRNRPPALRCASCRLRC